MRQNEYLKERSRRLDEIAAKPTPKRSQVEAYAQHDRLEQLSRKEAIAEIEQLPGDE